MNTIFTYNFVNKTIIGSKAAINRANKGINPEYSELTSMLAAHPTFNVVEKAIKKNDDKKTFSGLTIETMKSYILTLDNSKAKLIEFEAIQKVAKAKGAMYPLTKKWFLHTYPEFKNSELALSAEELKKVKAAEKEAEKALALFDDEEDFDEAC